MSDLFFNKRPATLLKKTLAQVFSCEFCEISKNTFFHGTLLMAVFELCTEIFRSLNRFNLGSLEDM